MDILLSHSFTFTMLRHTIRNYDLTINLLSTHGRVIINQFCQNTNYVHRLKETNQQKMTVAYPFIFNFCLYCHGTKIVDNCFASNLFRNINGTKFMIGFDN